MVNKPELIGFIFGILAIVFSITIILGVIFSIIGIIFSIKALTISKDKKKSHKRLEIAGIVLSLIGLLLSTFIIPFVYLFLLTFLFINSSVSAELTNQMNEQGIPGEIKITFNDIVYVSQSGEKCSFSEIQENNCNYLPEGIKTIEIEGLNYKSKGKYKYESSDGKTSLSMGSGFKAEY